MSADQWEKYVEPSLLALWRERFGPSTPVHEFGPEMQECVRAEVRAVLAGVGPLIAEDTRVRLVAAAARAVERTCSAPRGNRGDGRGCEDDRCPRHGEPEEEAG